MEKEWKDNKVIIKRLSLGENMKIRDEAMKVAIKNNGVDGTLSQEIAIVEKINKSVVEAPWETGNRKVVFDLDSALGEWILQEIQEFNSFPEKKKENTDGK